MTEASDKRVSTYGTSRFLISLCLTCNLSLNVVLGSLHILHQTTRLISLIRAERKMLAAACVSLSWKQWEDREGVQSSQKLRQLCKAYYLLVCQSARWRAGSSGSELCKLQDSVTEWVATDEGREQEALRERLKTYELLVLRATCFAIEGPEHLIPLVAKRLRDLAPGVEADAFVFDGLYQCALGILFDYLRWSNYLLFDVQNVCTAVALKAIVTMRVRMCDHVDSLTTGQLAFMNEEVGRVMEDIRATYQWAEECEREGMKPDVR